MKRDKTLRRINRRERTMKFISKFFRGMAGFVGTVVLIMIVFIAIVVIF